MYIVDIGRIGFRNGSFVYCQCQALSTKSHNYEQPFFVTLLNVKRKCRTNLNAFVLSIKIFFGHISAG